MDKILYDLPSRKIRSMRKVKNVLTAIFLVIAVIAVALFPLYGRLIDMLEDEAKIKYYFDDSGALTAVTGRYYRGEILSQEDALVSLSKLSDLTGYTENPENEFKLMNTATVTDSTVYRFVQQYKNIDVFYLIN